MSFPLNSLVRVLNSNDDSAGFINIDGHPVDPNEVFVRLKDPTGVETSFQYGVGADVVRSALGLYYIDVPGVTPGRWAYRWVGITDSVTIATQELYFTIDRSIFVNP